MNLFENHPVLLQTLQPWVPQELEEVIGSRGLEAAMVEDTITAIFTNHGMHTELPVWMLGVSSITAWETCMQKLACVAVQWCSREAQRLLAWQDGRAAGDCRAAPRMPLAPLPPEEGLCPSAASSGSPVRSRANSSAPHPLLLVGTQQPPRCSCCHPHGARRAPGGARRRCAQAPHFQPGQGTLTGSHGHPQRGAPAAPGTLQTARGQHHTRDPGGCLARWPNRDWATSCGTRWPSRAPSPQVQPS